MVRKIDKRIGHGQHIVSDRHADGLDLLGGLNVMDANDDASNYSIQVDNNPDFSSPKVNVVTTHTYYDVSG